MWPIPRLSSDHVCITFDSHLVTCSWIARNNNGAQPFELKAYQRYPLDHGEFAQQLFNPTYIKSCITNFLHHHALKNPSISASISGNGILEKLISVPMATPHADDFAMPELQSMVWDYIYLYPNDTSNFTFYVCGIARPLLFEYQLLSLAAHLNITMFTTPTTAALTLYTHLHGDTLRRNSLIHHVATSSQLQEKLFTNDSIDSLMQIKSTVLENKHNEAQYLYTALGLYVAGVN